MPIPSSMADLSTTSSLNSPSGSDNIAAGDDYLRSIQAILKAQVSTGGAITAASTITPDASGQYYVVSGSTGISAIASTNSWNGRIIVLEFSSSPIITHNGTSLILPGAANITAAAGDVAGFVQESSGNWRCVFYQKANGQAVVSPTGFAASGANSDITSLSALSIPLSVAQGGTGIATAQPSVSASRGSIQSITQATFTKIQLNGEQFDVGGYFDSTTNYRWTPLVAGKYLVCAGATYNGLDDQARNLIAVYKNGSSYLSAITKSSGVDDNTSTISCVLDMNGSTDYLELYTYHSSAAAKNLGSAFFTGIRISS